MASAAHKRCSRWLNGRLGGDPREMLCSRAYREGWRCTGLIDAVWWFFTSERQHCRQAAEYEALRRGH